MRDRETLAQIKINIEAARLAAVRARRIRRCVGIFGLTFFSTAVAIAAAEHRVAIWMAIAAHPLFCLGMVGFVLGAVWLGLELTA